VLSMHPLLAGRALHAKRVVKYTLLRFTCNSRSHSCFRGLVQGLGRTAKTDVVVNGVKRGVLTREAGGNEATMRSSISGRCGWSGRR
jgi:hypothetical protein